MNLQMKSNAFVVSDKVAVPDEEPVVPKRRGRPPSKI